MNDALKNTMDEIVNNINKKIKILNNHVNYLVSSKSKDSMLIEFTLDNILDTCLLEKGVEIFNKLCTYYETVNYDNALEYRKIYNELYGEENQKVLVKH